MPELPEVETMALQLAPLLTGRTIRRAIALRRDIVHGHRSEFGKALRGKTIRQVRRRAKRLIFELDPYGQLIFHMGMSGRLLACPRRTPIEPHTHVRIVLDSGDWELRFRDPRRFGGVWLVLGSRQWAGRELGPLGAEPLEVDANEFREILDRNRQIKALLLDQRVVAGLGNIYTDEALHRAGIHPLRKANSLGAAEASTLRRSIRATLARAIHFAGTTLADYRAPNGREGSFRRLHRVYQREGLPCKRCNEKVVRILAAGRSTFLCPRCQPWNE